MRSSPPPCIDPNALSAATWVVESKLMATMLRNTGHTDAASRLDESVKIVTSLLAKLLGDKNLAAAIRHCENVLNADDRPAPPRLLN